MKHMKDYKQWVTEVEEAYQLWLPKIGHKMAWIVAYVPFEAWKIMREGVVYEEKKKTETCEVRD